MKSLFAFIFLFSLDSFALSTGNYKGTLTADGEVCELSVEINKLGDNYMATMTSCAEVTLTFELKELEVGVFKGSATYDGDVLDFQFIESENPNVVLVKVYDQYEKQEFLIQLNKV